MPLRRITNSLREIRQAQGKSGYDLQLLTKIQAEKIYKFERGLQRPRPFEKRLLAEALGEQVEKVFPPGLERRGDLEGEPSK